MNNSLALVYLAILLVLLGWGSWVVLRQVLRTRRVEKDLSQLQNKVSSGSGTAQDHYELGSIYLRKKVFNQAIAQFQKALKAKVPGELESPALLYNALGYAYAAQEQYDLAIRQYKEALKLAPNYVTAINNLGFAYEKKQLTAQALEAYEASLKYEPENKTAKRRAESLHRRLA